jgi:hypothetical protein
MSQITLNCGIYNVIEVYMIDNTTYIYKYWPARRFNPTEFQSLSWWCKSFDRVIDTNSKTPNFETKLRIKWFHKLKASILWNENVHFTPQRFLVHFMFWNYYQTVTSLLSDICPFCFSLHKSYYKLKLLWDYRSQHTLSYDILSNFPWLFA